MRQIYKGVSAAALAAVVIFPLLYFFAAVSLDRLIVILNLSSLLWFIASSLRMKANKPG